MRNEKDQPIVGKTRKEGNKYYLFFRDQDVLYKNKDGHCKTRGI